MRELDVLLKYIGTHIDQFVELTTVSADSNNDIICVCDLYYERKIVRELNIL